VEDCQKGQAREHAPLLACARALRVWERGRDEVQGSVAVVLLLQFDKFAVLAPLLRLVEHRAGALGHNETLETLAALAVELVFEALRDTKELLNVVVAG